MWTPDVYDGAPTPVTGFMAAAVKAAAFAALFRVLLEAFGSFGMHQVWEQVIWWLAALTMIVGNLVALVQRSVKRMLAYSSIAHAGYLLTALVAGTTAGAAAFLFYLLFYTLMTVGAFAILALMGRGGERDVLVDDLAGLAESRPALALGLTVCMLSLLGFPGTAGFIGKWYILVSATGGGYGVAGRDPGADQRGVGGVLSPRRDGHVHEAPHPRPGPRRGAGAATHRVHAGGDGGGAGDLRPVARTGSSTRRARAPTPSCPRTSPRSPPRYRSPTSEAGARARAATRCASIPSSSGNTTSGAPSAWT